MPLTAERASATPQALEYRPFGHDKPRSLAWARLRAVTAEIEPAWSGAEVTLYLFHDGDRPSPADAPQAAGRRLEVFGNFAAARRLIEDARRHSPQTLIDPIAQLLIELPSAAGDESWYLAKRKDYAFAAEAYLALGTLNLAAGRLERADNDFQNAAKRSPLDAAAWRGLGLARLLARKAKDAQQAFDRLLRLGARDVETYYLHASSIYRQRGFAGAADELARAASARPGDAAVRDLLACSLVQQFLLPEALRELDVIVANGSEGWRLMAQKCRMCAQGHAEYRRRLATEPWFRWRERWRQLAARAGAAISIILSAYRALSSHYAWVVLILFPALVLGFFIFDRAGEERRVQDLLANAQGQAPNMPCWYVSLVAVRKRPGAGGNRVLRRIWQRFGGGQ